MITKALPNQSLLDIVIAKTGSLEALVDTAFLNNISITAQLTPGQEIETNIINNRKVVEYFKYNPHPATDILGGISMEELEELEERLMTEIAGEAADREAADADLQTQINSNTNVLATILGKEQNETLADLQTKYNALATGYKTVYGALTKLISFLESTDAVDTTINKWKEIETFLTGITDTDTLTGVIQNATADKVSSSELSFEKTILTNNITLAQNGYANTTATIYKNAYAAFVKLDISASYSYAPTEPMLIDLGIQLKEQQYLTVSFYDRNHYQFYPLTVHTDGKVYPVFSINSGIYRVNFFALLDTSAS